METEKRELFYKPLKRRRIIFHVKKIRPPELKVCQRADCAELGLQWDYVTVTDFSGGLGFHSAYRANASQSSEKLPAPCHADFEPTT
jgi:hypothetical protein